MKYRFILILITSSLIAHSQTLRQELLREEPKLEGLEIIKCKIDPTLFIVIREKQIGWWENLSVIKFRKNKIIWKAKFDKLPTSQSIISARQISLKGFKNPLIEIFDETHLGNGFYYLYELNGKNLKQLVVTIAVDKNEDLALEINNKNCSRLIKNKHLKPYYQDINKDGFVDLILKGKIQIVGDNYLKEYFAQKVFIYDSSKKKFIENFKLRKGFELEDD